MLELTKTVLKRVSFDKLLFRKELVKSKRWLQREEFLILKSWCLMTFAGQHDDIMMEVFLA